ncbi:hypothetical protein JTB14_032966 [Gonioctena quinquepunctata]|nr:hypothetical protein JTB14_032966 [Gonioctena quinquepunctata]
MAPVTGMSSRSEGHSGGGVSLSPGEETFSFPMARERSTPRPGSGGVRFAVWRGKADASPQGRRVMEDTSLEDRGGGGSSRNHRASEKKPRHQKGIIDE